MRERVRVAVRGACTLWLFLMLPMAGPTYGQTVATAAAATAGHSVAAPAYTALIGRTSYEAAAGVAFPMRVSLLVKVPPGSFVTVNVERLSGPDGGHVDSISGIPDTDITCSSPGTYRLRVRVDLVTKGSCGGVDATTLLEREIEVAVRYNSPDLQRRVVHQHDSDPCGRCMELP